MNRSIARGHVHERCKDNPPWAMVTAYRLRGDIEYRYFEEVMGLRMDDEKAVPYEQFLKDHLNESPDSPAEMYAFACDDG